MALLRRLENKDLPYDAFSIQDNRNTGQGLKDRCFMLKARASVVDLAREVPDIIDLQYQDHSVPVICIELVASRFLRRMVRKIVVRIHTYIHTYIGSTAYDKLLKTGYEYFLGPGNGYPGVLGPVNPCR